MTKTKISGTKEWSVASVNCVTGCSHDCRYCYARAMAVRYHRIGSPAEWSTMRVRPAEVRKPQRKIEGTVMFPTTHDITPEVLEPCVEVIGRLLEAGNRLLLVSKPHFDCVDRICEKFRSRRDRITWRFTVGALSDELRAYWEPGAPSLVERLAAMELAFGRGFGTGASCEPLLEWSRVEELVDLLSPMVTDTIWVGKMNQVRSRCRAGTSQEAIRRIEAGQTNQRVQLIYAALKDHPKIRWKESYKRVLGIDLAPRPGLDV